MLNQDFAEKTRRVSVATVLLLAVALVALTPLFVARFPPSADLYQWVYQGAVLARLAPWSGGDAPFENAFEVVPVPTPNLAAPVGIAALTPILGPTNAGRVFFALCVLVLGGGFAYLLRSVHRRPTALEPLGFAWAYGFMAYGGYMSNQFALGMALFAIGRLERMRRRDDGVLTAGDLATVAILGVLTYLAHLLGWVVLLVALAVHGIDRARSGRWRDGLRLAGTQLPAFALFAWYALARAGTSQTLFYTGVGEKFWVLVEPLIFFFRTDPFPSPFPLFGYNLILAAILATVLAFNLGRLQDFSSRSTTAFTGVLLIALAIALPIRSLGGANHLDKRFVLAGFLLAVAGLPLRRWSGRRSLAVVGFVSAILLLHAVEYGRASRELSRVREN